MAFNWVARALRWILVKGLKLVASNYFDDFTVFEAGCLTANTQELLNKLMTLLGFDIKPGKAFSKQFDVLGITLFLTHIPDGFLEVGNEDWRTASLIEYLLFFSYS